jgi:iron complex transport system substrate-binding protein
VGGLLNPSLEVIRELRPDLLIATTSGNDPGLASQAEALGLPLYTVHAETVTGVLEAAERLADALGDPESGVRLSSDLGERLHEIERRLEGGTPIRLLYVVWNDPLIVPGAPAFLTDALRYAGADSVTADAPAAWPAYSLESAIASAPEVILTSPQNRRLPEILSGIPAWSGVPAVRTGRIHVVGSFLERPGPGVIRGIEEIARLLHPDRFADLPAEENREGGLRPQKN